MSASRPHQSSAGGRSPVPPLSLHSPQVTELLRVCGENIGLVAHHWVIASHDLDARLMFLKHQLAQQQWNSLLLLLEPLARAFKDILGIERYCPALCCLVMKNGVTTGSQAEGLHEEYRPPMFQSTSDADFMLELGPVEWVFQTDRTPMKAASDIGAAAEAQRNPAALRLTIAETSNPGFVLLLHEPRSDCQHQKPLRFGAEHMKNVYSAPHGMVFEGTWKLNGEGPACSRSQPTDGKPFSISEMDHVPCLHVPVWWISDEFFTRCRRYSWPPKSAREDIRRYGLHLVAKGAPGSITGRFEWRISFSRAELIISLFLTIVQKGSVVLFKSCKTALGEESKALESYYVKTALFWLCEETQPEDWTSAHQGLMSLVEYLDAAVRERNLPCYFWTHINLFRFVSRDDLKAMKVTLGTIRQHWMRLLAYNACTVVPELTARLTQHTRRLSEDQVRVHLMRIVIRNELTGITCRYLQFIDSDLSKLLPMLLQSYPPEDAASVWRSVLPRFSVQSALYRALTMAPADLSMEVFQSLSGNSRDGFVWDAAPLLGLLTEDDLKWLLGDPDAVRSCLRRQRRLPVTKRLVGLPADLRSPRDLCDLLLNIPLLVQVIKESVPLKFVEMKCRASLDCATARISMYTMEKMREMTLHDAALWKKLITVFHMVGADQTTARRAACRFGVETRQLCDSPETLEAHRRIGHTLPDAWRMQHLVFDDARIGHVMCVTAT